MNDPKLLTAGEAAQAIGRSIDTIRRWDKQGWLKPSVRHWDGTRLYRQDYIQHFQKLWSTGKSPKAACEEIYDSYHREVDSNVAEAS